jgi:peptide-methionine (S)-S-oxide reductase
MTMAAKRWTAAILATAAVAALVAARMTGSARAETFARVPTPAVDEPRGPGLETAVLSGGCFWGVQGVFEHVKGVTKVLAGYAGGRPQTAHYEIVSTGVTGHAESVQITFDPAEISYGQILRIFFSVATDPTQVGGQFPDEGPQYRSEVWVANPEQRRVAEAYIAQLDAAHAFRKPISSRVDDLKGFYPAEAYHQDYLVRNPDAPYIAAWDAPRIAALKALFPDAWRGAPVLASR